MKNILKLMFFIDLLI